MKKLNWGILGTGAIAQAFARGLKQSESGNLVAVGSRTKESAMTFGKEWKVSSCHGSYEDLLADETVEAVYISTPHPFHPEWTIKALEAGKHVLCEKPLAINQWQVQAMLDVAAKQKRFLCEGFMYRFHPQTKRLVELIRDGSIGEVRMIRASFGFNAGPVDPESRLFSNDLGGGGILDVGCYAVSAARLIAGAAMGKPFENPSTVAGGGHVGETEVDESAAAVLTFPSGIVAQVATSTQASLDNTLEIIGSAGSIRVPNPWTADRQNPADAQILLNRDGETEEIAIPAHNTSFALEADGVAEAIGQGSLEAAPPAMTWDDSLGNIAALDEWRKAVGVVHGPEKPAPTKFNIAGKPVRVNRNTSPAMKFGQIPGLEKPVSKMVFGALAAFGSYAKAQVLFDHWLEAGGNAFDTSYQYGMGKCDQILGQWLESRGVRDEIVLLAKGAHTPYCDPENLTRQLEQSLDSLKTDYADIYIMHRDNEDIPVGEFIDVLNEHREAGTIKAFGGSNWSAKRFAEANAYAEKNGKQGMAVLNNNLSLARMVDPVWAGCIHMSDSESRQWMENEGIVHMAWSSQARGFFTERTQLELESEGYDEELRRSWFSEDNMGRRERAIAMARDKGVLPINIAAAYVLCQPFESYALVGPESIHQIETTLPALEVELTRQEIDFLWKGA